MNRRIVDRARPDRPKRCRAAARALQWRAAGRRPAKTPSWAVEFERLHEKPEEAAARFGEYLKSAKPIDDGEFRALAMRELHERAEPLRAELAAWQRSEKPRHPSRSEEPDE
jgi:hypothetical protein